MSQEPPDNFRPSDTPQQGQQNSWRSQPSNWSQQPPQQPSQADWQQQGPGPSWSQQPTQADWQQQTIRPTSWPQQQPQQFYQQPQQPPQQPGQPGQPPLPPGPPRRSFWRRYRKSRPAQVVSILLILLIIASVVLVVMHGTPGGGGGTTASSPTPGSGGGTTVTGGPADISVDFGGRQNHAHPISSTFLGIGGLGMTSVINTAAPYLPQANLKLTRIGDFMAGIFPTQASATDPAQQNWSQFDNAMTIIGQNHLQPILILSYTPAWLQPQNQNPPQPNYCLTNANKVDGSHVKPTFMQNGQDSGAQKWGQLAALVVAHMDAKFSNVHALYELWNEPDGITYWCEKDGDPNAGAERLSEYKTLYAAAAPLVKQQAQQDGVQIQIGGPALAFVTARATTWIPALVNDPTIAPYIDFISYHMYVNGKSWTQLVQKTQDAKVGYLAEFQLVASLVHAGHQPNAQSTPIYIDEYNGNACTPNLCRSNPTYAPLWNSLFIADLLNTVTTQIPGKNISSSVPAGVVYFTWSSPPAQYCMFGEINANLDCATGSNDQPYPQYYTYKLIGGPSFLNIADSAYDANAVASDKRGVIVAGFYTQGHDAILIVNTTATNYIGSNILAKNPGETSTTAMFYTLNSANSQIASQQVNLQHRKLGLEVTATIPAYSTVAITL